MSASSTVFAGEIVYQASHFQVVFPSLATINGLSDKVALHVSVNELTYPTHREQQCYDTCGLNHIDPSVPMGNRLPIITGTSLLN